MRCRKKSSELRRFGPQGLFGFVPVVCGTFTVYCVYRWRYQPAAEPIYRFVPVAQMELPAAPGPEPNPRCRTPR